MTCGSTCAHAHTRRPRHNCPCAHAQTKTQLPIGDLSDTSITDKVLRSYVDTQHVAQAYVPWTQGTLRGTCEVKQELWKEASFPLWNKDLLMSYKQILPPKPADSTARGDAMPASLAADGGDTTAPTQALTQAAAESTPGVAGEGGLAIGSPERRLVAIQGGRLSPDDCGNLTQGEGLAEAESGGGGCEVESHGRMDVGVVAGLGTRAWGGGGHGGAQRALLEGGGAGKEWWNALVCDETLPHTGIIIQRDTFANMFHDSEDFFNLFLTMAILGLSVDDVVVLLLDLYSSCPCSRPTRMICVSMQALVHSCFTFRSPCSQLMPRE